MSKTFDLKYITPKFSGDLEAVDTILGFITREFINNKDILTFTYKKGHFSLKGFVTKLNNISSLKGVIFRSTGDNEEVITFDEDDGIGYFRERIKRILYERLESFIDGPLQLETPLEDVCFDSGEYNFHENSNLIDSDININYDIMTPDEKLDFMKNVIKTKNFFVYNTLHLETPLEVQEAIVKEVKISPFQGITLLKPISEGILTSSEFFDDYVIEIKRTPLKKLIPSLVEVLSEESVYQRKGSGYGVLLHLYCQSVVEYLKSGLSGSSRLKVLKDFLHVYQRTKILDSKFTQTKRSDQYTLLTTINEIRSLYLDFKKFCEEEQYKMGEQLFREKLAKLFSQIGSKYSINIDDIKTVISELGLYVVPLKYQIDLQKIISDRIESK